MKIIISANSYWNIYNFRIELIKSLIKRNFEVIALANDDKYKKLILNETGIKCFNLKINSMGINPLDDLLLIKNYYKIFLKQKPDLILSFTIKPNIYGNFAAKLLGIKTINNITGLGTIFIKKNLISAIGKILYRFSLKFSGHIFFQNEFDQNLFTDLKIINNSNHSIIPGSGIDLNFFKCNRKKNLANNFVFLGRIIKDKGVIEFLDSALNVIKKFPGKKFILIGEFGVPNRTSIKKSQLKKYFHHPQIKFIGKSNNIKNNLKNADVLILPSYREGLSRALLEGGAMSLPLITTNVPGCNDVVVDGYNGYLCEKKSISSLTKSILRMINNSEAERLTMGKNARILVEKKFSIENIVSIYHKKIDDLLI